MGVMVPPNAASDREITPTQLRLTGRAGKPAYPSPIEGEEKKGLAQSAYRRLTTLSDWRGSRRSPRYWLAIGSSATSTALPWPKPLKAVRIAAP